MLIKPNFKNSRKADKAAALLALSADQGAKPGRCLSSEEMATLIDKQCTGELRAIYLQHLSGCAQCYDEWLALLSIDKMAGDLAVGDRQRRGRRIKKYGFIGSALTLAASVAIFLNLNHLPPLVQQTEDRSAAETGVEKSLESTPGEQVKQQVDRLKKARSMAPVAPESVPKMKEVAAPMPPAAADMARTTGQAELYGDGTMGPEANSWLQALQKNCLAGRQDGEFWRDMAIQGQKIVDAKDSHLANDTKEKVTAALALVQAMVNQPITEQCRQLLSLLAQPPKSK